MNRLCQRQNIALKNIDNMGYSTFLTAYYENMFFLIKNARYEID